MPIMINTKTIGAICVTRQDELADDTDEYTYQWEVSMNGATDLRGKRRPPMRMMGTVTHNYDAGALTLLKKVMAQIP